MVVCPTCRHVNPEEAERCLRCGTSLEPDAIFVITLHEIGHVLGLDHTQDERSIMAARVRVRDLSLADEHTAQLIYSIPPGSVTRP